MYNYRKGKLSSKFKSFLIELAYEGYEWEHDDGHVTTTKFNPESMFELYSDTMINSQLADTLECLFEEWL